MVDLIAAIQTAIQEHAELGELSGPWFSRAGDDAALSYIVIHDMGGMPKLFFDSMYFRPVTFRYDIWHNDLPELLAYQQALYDLFVKQRLTLTTGHYLSTICLNQITRADQGDSADGNDRYQSLSTFRHTIERSLP